MKLILTPLAGDLKRLYAQTKREFFICSPWIKRSAVDLLVGRKPKPNVTHLVMTVGDLRDFLTGASDLSAFSWLKDEGADIRIFDHRLHAKVYLSDRTRAIVTSANLTESGLHSNLEVGVLLEGQSEVAELVKFFDDWFKRGTQITAAWLEKMHKLERANGEGKRNWSQISEEIERAGADLQGTPIQLAKANTGLRRLSSLFSDKTARKRIVERIKLAPSREWMDRYFDLMRDLIDHTKLFDGNPRLVMSLPKQPEIFPVSINQRYVLFARFFKQKPPRVSFLYPKSASYLHEKPRYSGSFDKHANEKKGEVPRWLSYDNIPKVLLSGKSRQDWLDGASAEIFKGRRSSYAMNHEPLIYRAAKDLRFRAELLEEAFG